MFASGNYSRFCVRIFGYDFNQHEMQSAVLMPGFYSRRESLALDLGLDVA
jgi:hypothetical protein